jgi:hypothetical protein
LCLDPQFRAGPGRQRDADDCDPLCAIANDEHAPLAEVDARRARTAADADAGDAARYRRGARKRRLRSGRDRERRGPGGSEQMEEPPPIHRAASPAGGIAARGGIT